MIPNCIKVKNTLKIIHSGPMEGVFTLENFEKCVESLGIEGLEKKHTKNSLLKYKSEKESIILDYSKHGKECYATLYGPNEKVEELEKVILDEHKRILSSEKG